MASTVSYQVHRYIEGAIPNGPFKNADVVAKIKATLTRENPQLLADWEDELSTAALMKAVADYQGEMRRRDQARIRAAATMGNIQEAIATGSLAPFRQHLCVAADNTRKAIGDMTRADCEYVAADRYRVANNAKLEAAFWDMVAKKLTDGKKIVDVLDQGNFCTMYAQITGAPFANAA